MVQLCFAASSLENPKAIILYFCLHFSMQPEDCNGIIAALKIVPEQAGQVWCVFCSNLLDLHTRGEERIPG
jgi:hypothetical protein